MALTCTQMISRVQSILGDDDTAFTTHLQGSLNNMLLAIWDMHDWEWKHKTGTFNTVAGTEEYTLSSSAADIRSSQDIECLYDSTNGRVLSKVDLKEIRKKYPKHDSSGQPTHYAPWGSKKIFLHQEPDGIYVMKFLYLSKPTLPSTYSEDLESSIGIPDYMHPLLEKMLLSEGMLYVDDNRYAATVQMFSSIMLRNAIKADMRHVESNARFKFWEEELTDVYPTYDSFLSYSYWAERD